MNYSKIFCIVYTISTCTINAASDNFNQELMSDIFIPLEIEISLDFLKIEIEKNQNILQNDWNSIQSQSIIKKAESITKNSPKDLTENIKTKIISFFKEIDINIIFTENDTIIKDDETTHSKIIFIDKHINDENKEKLAHDRILAQKKYRTLHTDTGHKSYKRKRIHGARRTMKRLKQQHEDEVQKEKERHKKIIEAFHAHRQTPVKKTNEKGNIPSKLEHQPAKPSYRPFTTKPQKTDPFEHEEKPPTFTMDPTLN